MQCPLEYLISHWNTDFQRLFLCQVRTTYCTLCFSMQCCINSKLCVIIFWGRPLHFVLLVLWLLPLTTAEHKLKTIFQLMFSSLWCSCALSCVYRVPQFGFLIVWLIPFLTRGHVLLDTIEKNEKALVFAGSFITLFMQLALIQNHRCSHFCCTEVVLQGLDFPCSLFNLFAFDYKYYQILYTFN